MDTLPIDQFLPEITSKLKSARALVLKAEPGAGKTTRVPPAILDAGLAALDSGKAGQIVVLQPRRVAARAAASRIAEERSTVLGGEVGYRVRHEGKASKDTRILVCTTGVFLRRLQEDPSIEDIAVVVFDEFHERSVDSDLALALTRQVQTALRPDLHIVVMSATLDGAPIARYLGDCPTVECPGRTFPIAIEYLPHTSALANLNNIAIDRIVFDGVSKMLSATTGDVLVFLPGVGEIRQTQARLESLAESENFQLMTLYGDMPLGEQQLVLQTAKKRKVILATNVAETSLTIDGVTVVIDSGFARVNRFNSALGINRLDLSRISRASATQRAGRAGRTGPGTCLRLWSENDYLRFAEFELPEIERVELSECILQLMAWGEHDFAAFPWFEKPPQAVIEKACLLLEQLGATEGGKITRLGKDMSRLPLQPRLARLLIEGATLGHGRRAAICAAILAERAPFRADERDREIKDRRSQHSPAAYHSDSDVLEQVRGVEQFESNGERRSAAGEILPAAARQILRVADQLLKQIEKNKSATCDTSSPEVQEDEAILRAIMVAFPDRICKRRAPKEPRAVMVGGRGVKLSDQSQLGDAPLFVAVDLIDQNKSELAIRSASTVEEKWLPPSLVKSAIEVVYDAPREKIVAFKRTRFVDIILDEKVASLPPEADAGSALAEAIITNFDLDSLVDEAARDYMNRLRCLQENLPDLDLPVHLTWQDMLPFMCMGINSVAELKQKSFTDAIQAELTHQQIMAIESDAPEYFSLPSGRRVKMQYEPGQAPILPARIQELFGLTETPKIARGKIALMLHLLAPNYRVQQITPDLAGFWKNTYPEVKKELKGRYPKHAWPDDPTQKPATLYKNQKS